MSARLPQDVLLRPLLTEKTMWLRDSVNQYAFEVPLDANKIEIRQAIRALFPKVKVLSVNTMRRGGKKRRVRGTKTGLTKRTKRAIVTLAPGQTIELV
jgi:large subunit ribosomal protein L23